MTKELVLKDTTAIEDALQKIALREEFINRALVEGKDYGTEKGIEKPFLKKPGAEKLNLYFRAVPFFDLIEKTEDWDRGFFHYSYRCTLKHRDTGEVLAQCDGSHNSHEPRYRYRWVWENEIPEGIDRTTLKTRTFERKKDGKKFTQYRMVNEDVAGQVNTIQKMAQKSAYVGTTLLATATSDFFTQDIGDSEKDTETESTTETKTASQPPQPSQPQSKQDPELINDGELIGVRTLVKKTYPELVEAKDRHNVLAAFLKEQFDITEGKQIRRDWLMPIRYFIEHKLIGGALRQILSLNWEDSRLLELTKPELDELMVSIQEGEKK